MTFQRRILLLIAFLVLATGVAEAQVARPAPSIDTHIATQVELAGFPTTGSQIEAARQAISQHISNEIDHVAQQIGELERTSSVGRLYVEEIEAEAAAAPPVDSRWGPYRDRPRTDPTTGEDTRPVLPRQPEGIDAQIDDVANRIADSVRDLFRSEQGAIPEYHYTGQNGSEGLQGLLERFRERLGTLPDDPRAVMRQLKDAIVNGTDNYIDERIERYRNITKRVINRYIQIMTASDEVPISGYWRVEPFVVEHSGNCISYYCDGCGGGVIPQPEEADPGEPLCGYDAEPPFLVWRGLEHPYLPGTSNIFSRATTSEWQTARDGNGATIRNMRVNHTTEYEVVAPDRIIVRDFTEEVGGCSFFAEYVLTLVRQDETVCNIMELPGDLPLETPETTPPPGEERTMRIGQPFYTDEAACLADNTPPITSNEVRLTAQGDGSMRLDYAGGSVTLYTESANFYVFESGTDVSPRQTIYLTLLEGGVEGDLSWSITNADGQNCYVSFPLSLPGAEGEIGATPPPAATDAPDNGSADQPDAGLDIAPGVYTAEWIDIPGLCQEALRPEGPSFSEVTISLPEPGLLVMAWESGELRLSHFAPGMYVTTISNDALNASVSLTAMGDGTHAFGWSAGSTTDTSLTCTLMATLTPKPG
jgi:hypothetical protein